MNKRQLLAVRTILKEWPNTKHEDEDRLIKTVASSLSPIEYLEVSCFIFSHEQKTTSLH